MPLIVGRALKLSPQQVVMLISADLFLNGAKRDDTAVIAAAQQAEAH